MRLVFGRATIFQAGADSTGIATTSTTNKCHTCSAGTKHCEMHSLIGNAGSVKHTWRRSNNCTPTAAKQAPRWVMVNMPTDEWRRCMRWVVSGTLTYTRGMRVPESNQHVTASNDSARSVGRMHLGVHVQAKNHSCRFVDEPTLEVIISRVNQHIWRRVNQCIWRWNNTWTQQMRMWIPRHVTASPPGEGVETIPRGKPASTTSNSRYVHQAQHLWTVYLPVCQLQGRLVWMYRHRSAGGNIKPVWVMRNEFNYVYQSGSKWGWKWSLNLPKCLPNYIARDSHQTALPQTITEWHH